MYMLAFESSAKAASVALAHDGALAAQYFQCTGLTHSRTLLPMAEDLLRSQELKPSDIDVFAVSHGPGSFTGVRIGISTVKGLCWGTQRSAIGVSTLEAMAYNGQGAAPCSVICCAMDARRNQVYNALFTFSDGVPVRLCADRAIRLEELARELESMSGRIILAGDGAELAHKSTEEKYELAPYQLRFQRGSGVCLAAQGRELIDPAALMPSYLRLPQAERERLAREGKPVTE